MKGVFDLLGQGVLEGVGGLVECLLFDLFGLLGLGLLEGDGGFGWIFIV